jgi:3-hydroxyisobutyrate dehydrogenase-like beta-hydroxyacid dehydrogenase
MRIAFLGLGAMGRALVERLLAAGHDVTVWNRSRGPVDELVAKGAHAASSPADAARADVVCSMLADDRALAAVWLDGGALAAMARGSIHVNHATISVGFARELIARHRDGGIGYVAAPVFGRPESIAKGSLNVLAAGVASDVARVLPLLEALGKKVGASARSPRAPTSSR